MLFQFRHRSVRMEVEVDMKKILAIIVLLAVAVLAYRSILDARCRNFGYDFAVTHNFSTYCLEYFESVRFGNRTYKLHPLPELENGPEPLPTPTPKPRPVNIM